MNVSIASTSVKDLQKTPQNFASTLISHRKWNTKTVPVFLAENISKSIIGIYNNGLPVFKGKPKSLIELGQLNMLDDIGQAPKRIVIVESALYAFGSLPFIVKAITKYDHSGKTTYKFKYNGYVGFIHRKKSTLYICLAHMY